MRATEFRELLIARGIATPETLVGCTEEEITELERAKGLELPETYKQFLRIAGVKAGEFMADIDAFYPAIRELTTGIREDLEGIVELPPQAFVFAQRLGEWLTFFIADGTDDPIIYGWSEADETQTKAFYTGFWDFIADELKCGPYAQDFQPYRGDHGIRFAPRDDTQGHRSQGAEP